MIIINEFRFSFLNPKLFMHSYLNSVVPDGADRHVAALFVHPVDEGAEGGQLHDHHHGLAEDDSVEADQVLVIQGVHSGTLLYNHNVDVIYR